MTNSAAKKTTQHNTRLDRRIQLGLFLIEVAVGVNQTSQDALIVGMRSVQVLVQRGRFHEPRMPKVEVCRRLQDRLVPCGEEEEGNFAISDLRTACLSLHVSPTPLSSNNAQCYSNLV